MTGGSEAVMGLRMPLTPTDLLFSVLQSLDVRLVGARSSTTIPGHIEYV